MSFQLTFCQCLHPLSYWSGMMLEVIEEEGVVGGALPSYEISPEHYKVSQVISSPAANTEHCCSPHTTRTNAISTMSSWTVCMCAYVCMWVILCVCLEGSFCWQMGVGGRNGTEVNVLLYWTIGKGILTICQAIS